MARIDISFKSTNRDMEVYNYWFNVEDRSAIIKEILRSEMNKRKCNQNKTINNINELNNNIKNDVDVFNF